MFIAVDIGNTNVTVGVLKDQTVISSFKFSTDLLKTKRRAAGILKDKCRDPFFSKEKIKALYICSVVQILNKNARMIFESVFKKNISFVGEEIIVPIINRYRIPKQVGQDRLINAYAGIKLYGGGLIIVDFGTAVTFDIVSKKCEYLGGLIAPGLRLMQGALNKKTALLPFVELSRPIEIIGGDTVSSIRAGIVYGVAGLCDGIIGRLLKKECKGFKIIATGGDISLIKPYSSYFSVIDDFLILKGLALIYKSQQSFPH